MILKRIRGQFKRLTQENVQLRSGIRGQPLFLALPKDAVEKTETGWTTGLLDVSKDRGFRKLHPRGVGLPLWVIKKWSRQRVMVGVSNFREGGKRERM